MAEMWTYRSERAPEVDITGYKVEATDGEIGEIAKEVDERGSTYIVVDTGPWIFGKSALLPAGVIQRIDHENEKIYVDHSKDQIKDAPTFDEDAEHDETYRRPFAEHYGGARGREPDSEV